MISDGGKQVARAAVVEEENPLPESPQWRRTKLIAARPALRYVVRKTTAHMVNLKIGKGLHGGATERGCDVGRLSGSNGRGVAGRTADRLE